MIESLNIIYKALGTNCGDVGFQYVCYEYVLLSLVTKGSCFSSLCLHNGAQCGGNYVHMKPERAWEEILDTEEQS